MNKAYAIKETTEIVAVNSETKNSKIKVVTRIVGVYSDKNNAMIDSLRFINFRIKSETDKNKAKLIMDYTKEVNPIELVKKGENYCSAVYSASEMCEESTEKIFTDDEMKVSEKLTFIVSRCLEIEETRYIRNK